MPLFNDTSKFRFLPFLPLILGVNFLFSYFIPIIGFFHVKNYFPVGTVSATPYIIVIVGSFLIYKLQLLTKFPLITCLLIIGAVSNFLEFLIFGYVVDYVNIGIAVLNLADLQIYGGLILLNWKLIREKQY